MLFRLLALAVPFGLVVGYDEGSISGAVSLISNAFAAGAVAEGIITAAVPLGAMGGVILTAAYADRLGRRKVLFNCAALFIIGAILSGLSPSVAILTISRLLLGVATGATMMVAPMYLAELAPAKNRGMVVFSLQLLLTIGIVVSYLVDAILTPSGNWQWMLAIGTVPAALAVFGLLVVPESPRWLASNGRVEEARLAIAKTQPHLSQVQVDGIVAGIKAAGERYGKTVSLGMFFQPQYRFVTLFAIFAFVFAQLNGINAIIYYAPTILSDTGAPSPRAALIATIVIGTVNVLATIVSMGIIDRFGRRPLMIGGFVGMSISLAVIILAEMVAVHGAGIVTLVGLFAFIASFAVSLGPLPWLYMTELFPLALRSKGMAMACSANWFFNFIVVLVFPELLYLLGSTVTFCIFLGFCVIGVFIAVVYAPETKGVSLEDLEQQLTSQRHRRLGRTTEGTGV